MTTAANSRPDYENANQKQSPKSFIYTTLLKQTLGSLPALIISLLYSYGSLNLRDLATNTKSSKVKLKKVLVKLIQLNCVKYFEGKGQTVYSVNEEGLLVLLYSGELIAYLEKKYDDSKVAEVAQNFLSHGNLTINDYKQFHESDDAEWIQIEKKIVLLVSDGWLVPIKSSYGFQDRSALYRQLYQKNYASHPKASGVSETKRKQEVKVETEEDFARLFDFTSDDIYESNEEANMVFLASLASGAASNNTLASPLTHKKIKPNVSFKFCLGRYFKHLRSDSLTKLANQRLGPLSAKIYNIILENNESQSPECFRYSIDFQDAHLFVHSKIESCNAATMVINSQIPGKSISQFLEYCKLFSDPDKKNCFTLQDIAIKLQKGNISLSNTIKFKNERKRKLSSGDENGAAKKIKDEDNTAIPKPIEIPMEDEGVDFDTESLNGLLFQHFELLIDSQFAFLRKHQNGSYYVPYAELIPQYQQLSYSYLIKAALGTEEFKVLNCILSNKLVDEKSLINQTLLNENLLRVCVSRLFKIQAIEIQEIPKTIDRQANRSAFAYRFNKKFATELIENNVLHEMSLIFCNIIDTKERNKLLLIKANREDIKGHEEEMLSTSDINQLKWLNETETNCISRIQRARKIWETYGIF